MLEATRDLVAFTKDPYSTMERLHARNGPVSWLGPGPVRFALLLGPEANRFVLANSELFSWRRAFAGMVPLAGPGALLVNDGERHRRLRRLVRPAFTTRRVAEHMGTVQRHIDRVTGSWRRGDVVEVYAAFRHAMRRATIESLFGARAVERAEPLQERLQAIHRLVDTSSLARRVQSLGLPAWRRALAARQYVQRWVAEEIARRRAEEGADSAAGPDVLGTLLASRDGDGARLTDPEISDQLISLLEAGAETTSSAFAWTLYCALRDRAVWEALTAEVGAVVPADERIGPEHLERMGYLDRVVAETLRLYPATVVAARMAATPFSFAGQDFPAGSKLVFSPYHTHRLAEVWTAPLRFDPERWDPQREGYRRPEPHEYLPFGGGPHRCVGDAFATMAVKTATAQLARHLDLWLVSTRVEPTGLIGMRPKDGLTLLVSRTERTKEVRP